MYTFLFLYCILIILLSELGTTDLRRGRQNSDYRPKYGIQIWKSRRLPSVHSPVHPVTCQGFTTTRVLDTPGAPRARIHDGTQRLRVDQAIKPFVSSKNFSTRLPADPTQKHVFDRLTQPTNTTREMKEKQYIITKNGTLRGNRWTF